jgi:hypothetical protein
VVYDLANYLDMALDQPPLPDFAGQKSAQQATEVYAAALAHRSTLARLEEQTQSDYDKAVMSLSGGALGVSLLYIRQVADSPPYAYWSILLVAWSAWTLSVTSCLFSLAISGVALRKEIDQLDEELLQERPGTIDEKKAKGGRVWDAVTGFLNWAGSILFVVGAVSMFGFVWCSQYDRYPPVQAATAITSTPAAISSPSQSVSGPTPPTQHGSVAPSPTAQPTNSNATP